MAHSVFVGDTVARVAASLNKVDRRAYDTTISGLKGGGCKAAGYRLAATDGGDLESSGDAGDAQRAARRHVRLRLTFHTLAVSTPGEVGRELPARSHQSR